MVDQRLRLLDTQVEPEDAATIHHENRFGGRARSLTGPSSLRLLVIAVLLCGALLLLPSWWLPTKRRGTVASAWCCLRFNFFGFLGAKFLIAVFVSVAGSISGD
jgi:hypothetical protein